MITVYMIIITEIQQRLVEQ